MRINLAAFDTEKCSLAELNSAFCESANLRRGSLDGFLKKLNVLVSELPRLRFGFTAKELDEYLLKYREAGYPAVSHSEEYRRAYKPAYRVVLESEANGRYISSI